MTNDGGLLPNVGNPSSAANRNGRKETVIPRASRHPADESIPRPSRVDE